MRGCAAHARVAVVPAARVWCCHTLEVLAC